MLLAVILISIALLSVGMSYLSLRNDMKKQKHVEEVQKKLAKGRVLFYSPGSSSSSEA